MSSQGHHLPSVPFQKSVISGTLNSIVLFIFLSGGHFGLFVFTLRIYSRRPYSGHLIVTSVLSLLSFTIFGLVIIQWYLTSITFSGAPANRLQTFAISVGPGPNPVVPVLGQILQGVEQILADGLLVWRCWHILSHRRYVRMALTCLYLFELALIVVGNVVAAISQYELSLQTVQFERKVNIVKGTSFCVTAATSMIATSLIAAHIYSSTSLNLKSRRRYTHIVEIMVQSSALYSLSMLGLAILDLINNANSNLVTSANLNAENYSSTVAVISTAFAPTLMVARLELQREKSTDAQSTTLLSDTRNSGLSAFALTQEEHSDSEIREIPV